MRFKSDRAAKMAMTKAERAYVEAKHAAVCAYGDAMANPELGSPLDYHEKKRVEADLAWEKAHEVYQAARAQGFWVKSWHFGSNPTRDLILNNMD
jgi:hypothetical protein